MHSLHSPGQGYRAFQLAPNEHPENEVISHRRDLQGYRLVYK